MTAKECAFIEKPGEPPCGAKATHEVWKYFVNGKGLPLCTEHVKPWMTRHLFGVPETK